MPKVYDAETKERAIPVVVLDSSGAQSGAGGDATAANQVTQTGILTTMDADTGNIATATAALATAIGTEDTAPGATPKLVRIGAKRVDSLSTVTPAAGDELQLLVDANGALWVMFAGALAATTDGIHIGTSASATDGASIYKTLDLDETEEDVKTSAGNLYGFIITNVSAGTRYVKFYNATAASVTVGSTTPVMVVAVPTGAGVSAAYPFGIPFNTAICVAATTGVADADTGAPGANEVICTFFYK